MDEQNLLDHIKLRAKQDICKHDWQRKNKTLTICKSCKLEQYEPLVKEDKQPACKHRFVRIGKHQQVCKDCGKKEKV